MPSGQRAAFVRAYGPDGDWAALFAQAPGFVAVTLLADSDTPGRFVTLDRWVDEAAFRAFRADPALAAAYDSLDRACAELTTHETRLGAFVEEGDVSGAPRFSPWRPHPWHGLSTGPEPPRRVYAYIEITPFDLVKYEIDKDSGYLKVDRPQRTSSLPPTLYGFLPRTYAGKRVAACMAGATDGDHDPLDVCVISERPIARPEIMLEARVIGGVPMLDAGAADDKILAVLSTDPVWGEVEDVSGLPRAMVDRIVHYFASYKQLPGESPHGQVGIVYGKEHAFDVVRAAMADYAELVPPA